jgi:alanine-synthesizing transaminase
MFADRTKWNLESNRLGAALAKHRAEGKRLIDLTVSNPTECGFEYDRAAILDALGNASALRYEPNAQGLETARRTVSDYYAERGDDVVPADMFLTTGTSEGYSFVFRLLCNPGDEVLVPTPSYPLLDFLAEIQDVKLVRYPLVYDHGWQIDFHGLERAITSRTRAVAIVHPNNPTGHFAKKEEVARLNEICARREIALIVDEVFLDFALGEKRPTSFAANEAALTFTMSGLSKISGLPQMKLAWLVVNGPANVKTQAIARLEVIADTYLSMNAPIQLAAPVLFAQRYKFQKELIARVQENLLKLDQRLAAQKACARLEIEGGWYAVLRVPATRSDEDLAIELLNTEGIFVHPGHFYEFAGDGYLVLSLIAPVREFAEGIKLLLEAF